MSPRRCIRPVCLWGPDPAAPPRWHTEPAGAAAVRPLTAGRPPANWVLHRRSSAAEFGGQGGRGAPLSRGGRAFRAPEPRRAAAASPTAGLVFQTFPTEGRSDAAEGCAMLGLRNQIRG